jgi:hypothetical protein
VFRMKWMGWRVQAASTLQRACGRFFRALAAPFGDVDRTGEGEGCAWPKFVLGRRRIGGGGKHALVAVFFSPFRS